MYTESFPIVTSSLKLSEGKKNITNNLLQKQTKSKLPVYLWEWWGLELGMQVIL